MSYRWSFNASLWEPTVAQLLRISSIIQPEEKTRIGRFVFIKDAKSSLIGRLLIRKLIQIKTGVPNDQIKLGRDDKNKPVLLSPNAENLNFNISHQGSFVVLASDPEASVVGIDVMNIDKPGRVAGSVDEYFRLMKRQFTEDEWRQIRGFEISDRKKMTNFTRFWCLKEAYVKAVGVGIVIDLRTINFQTKTDLDFETGRKLATDTEVNVNGILEPEWSFEERFLDEIHIVGVAKKNNCDDDNQHKNKNPPEFTKVSLDFLLENMSPLESSQEDKEWVEAFLKKKKAPDIVRTNF